MAILDYSSILGRPYQGAGQVAIQTAGALQGLRGNEQQMTQQAELHQGAKDAAQNKAVLSREAQEVFARNDVDEIAAFSVANPILGKNILASKGIVDTAGKERVSNRFANILTSTNPQEALEQEIALGEAENPPRDMTQSKQILAQGMDADGIQKAAGMALASIDGQRFKDIKLSLDDKKGATLSAEASSFNELIKNFSPEEQKTARRVKAGLKGRSISNAELSAIESGDIKSYSDYKIKQKQAEKFAELTGSSRSKAIDAGFERIQKIDVGMNNIDRAVTLLENDAGVGAIEKWLPSIKASTVALNNLQSTMALDVIGAVTFGALSQGELDLAKDVALNTKLDTPDLITDLKARKAAQGKLRAYFTEQIQHLDQGGTKASFLRKKEQEMEAAKQSQQGGGEQDNQALQWAQANPDDPRAAQIMQKLQGNQ